MSLPRSIVTAALLAAFIHTPLRAELARDLVAYWDFEAGAGNTAPGAAPGYDGRLMGAAAIAPDARVGSGALRLNGEFSYLSVRENVDTSKAWTISAWFKTAAKSVTKRQGVFESGTNFAMSFGLRESTSTPGHLNPQVSTNSKAGKYLMSNQDVPWEGFAGVWHHVVEIHTPATVNAKGSIVTFLDGKRCPVITLAPGDVLLQAEGLRLGTYRTADARWFNGEIDEVALWNRSLSEVEAAELFRLGGEGKPVVEVSETKAGAVVVAGTETGNPSSGSKTGIVIAGIAVVLAALAGAAFVVIRKKRARPEVRQPAYLPPPPGH